MRSAPARAAALYETFLAGCYEKAEELDDSRGNFGMFVDRLFSGWVKACQAASADPDETVRRIVAWMDDDPYGFCYQLERNLVKVLDRRSAASRQTRSCGSNAGSCWRRSNPTMQRSGASRMPDGATSAPGSAASGRTSWERFALRTIARLDSWPVSRNWWPVQARVRRRRSSSALRRDGRRFRRDDLVGRADSRLLADPTRLRTPACAKCAPPRISERKKPKLHPKSATV